jgi:hypothetical protein
MSNRTITVTLTAANADRLANGAAWANGLSALFEAIVALTDKQSAEYALASIGIGLASEYDDAFEEVLDRARMEVRS